MDHQFKSLYRNQDEKTGDDDRDILYVSEKLLSKISKYLEKEPGLIRCDEISEDGWFNKKESYIQKRLKHRRNEGKFCLGINGIYRSFNGRRVTKYRLYWLYERDVYFINKDIAMEPGGETVPTGTLGVLYKVVNVDEIKKG